MKIIKKGSLKKKEITKSCYNCHTKFVYTEHDIKIDQRDGDYVECPVCKSFINVGYKNYSILDH